MPHSLPVKVVDVRRDAQRVHPVTKRSLLLGFTCGDMKPWSQLIRVLLFSWSRFFPVFVFYFWTSNSSFASATGSAFCAQNLSLHVASVSHPLCVWSPGRWCLPSAGRGACWTGWPRRPSWVCCSRRWRHKERQTACSPAVPPAAASARPAGSNHAPSRAHINTRRKKRARTIFNCVQILKKSNFIHRNWKLLHFFPDKKQTHDSRSGRSCRFWCSSCRRSLRGERSAPASRSRPASPTDGRHRRGLRSRARYYVNACMCVVKWAGPWCLRWSCWWSLFLRSGGGSWPSGAAAPRATWTADGPGSRLQSGGWSELQTRRNDVMSESNIKKKERKALSCSPRFCYFKTNCHLSWFGNVTVLLLT